MYENEWYCRLPSPFLVNKDFSHPLHYYFFFPFYFITRVTVLSISTTYLWLVGDWEAMLTVITIGHQSSLEFNLGLMAQKPICTNLGFKMKWALMIRSFSTLGLSLSMFMGWCCVWLGCPWIEILHRPKKHVNGPKWAVPLAFLLLLSSWTW